MQTRLVLVCTAGWSGKVADWVVEVLSAATAGYDQVRKLAVYERHRIREYWLVHPVDRVVTIYRLVDGAYGRPIVHELQGRSSCSACPGVTVDWETVVRGLPDDPAQD